MAKALSYGAGVIGATVGALLAGQVALEPVFAQAAPGVAPAAEAADAPAAEAADAPAAADAAAVPAADPAANPASDGDEADALKARARLPQDEALQVALAQFPGGTVQSTIFGDENGLVVYEIVVRDPAGAPHKVKVDANTGAIVHAPDD